MRLTLIFAAFLASTAAAQEGVRSSDTILNQAEMDELFTGTLIEFFDGSKSRYAADGTYAYTYTDDGPEWTGIYSFSDDSIVCVDFDNGSNRCDRFVRNGERLVLIIEDGTRFPVRNRTVYAN